MAKSWTQLLCATVALLCVTSAIAQDDPRLARDAVSPVDVTFSRHNATIHNVSSDKRITALCGFFDYITPMGKKHRTRWTYSYSGPLALDNCLDPGAQHSYRPKRRRDDRSKYIEYETFEVSGVVFASGGAWGPLGNYCRSRMADVASATHLQLMDMQLINQQDPKRFQDFIIAKEPMLHGHEAKTVHLSIRSLLLNSEGMLRPDYEEILREAIARLSKY